MHGKKSKLGTYISLTVSLLSLIELHVELRRAALWVCDKCYFEVPGNFKFSMKVTTFQC